MYDLTIFSIFRDSAHYLERYAQQVKTAVAHAAQAHLVWLEGDSLDDTPVRLQELSETLEADVTLVKFDTGGPYWPSINHPDRWRQLEACWNRALKYLEPTRMAVCVESDLIWDWPTLEGLVSLVDSGCCEVACPMLMRSTPQTGPYFYDTNAFTKDGQHFTNGLPYHPALRSGERFVTLDTAGGLLVSTGAQLSRARWRDQCVLHFAPNARIVLDSQLRIFHP